MTIKNTLNHTRDSKGQYIKMTASDFWNCIEKVGGCWNWKGSIAMNGYGKLKFGKKYWSAHRLSYFLTHGKLTEGLTIDHLCHNKRCVNPDHLEEVPFKINAQRRSTSILDQKKVSEIKKLYKTGRSQYYISKLFGVVQPQISNIINNKRWSNVI